MTETQDKRNRLELLMKQAELPASLIDPYFLEGYIERVEVSRSNKEWKITIRKDTLVPAQAYRTFLPSHQGKNGAHRGNFL